MFDSSNITDSSFLFLMNRQVLEVATTDFTATTEATAEVEVTEADLDPEVHPVSRDLDSLFTCVDFPIA